MKKFVPGFTLALCASACLSVETTRLPGNHTVRQAFPSESVDVLLADDELPSDTCERLAILDGSGENRWTSRSDMLDKLREEAGKRGANVVQLRSMEEPGISDRIPGVLLGLALGFVLGDDTNERIGRALLIGGIASVGGVTSGALRRSSAVALHCPPTKTDDGEKKSGL